MMSVLERKYGILQVSVSGKMITGKQNAVRSKNAKLKCSKFSVFKLSAKLRCSKN